MTRHQLISEILLRTVTSGYPCNTVILGTRTDAYHRYSDILNLYLSRMNIVFKGSPQQFAEETVAFERVDAIVIVHDNRTCSMASLTQTPIKWSYHETFDEEDCGFWIQSESTMTKLLMRYSNERR